MHIVFITYFWIKHFCTCQCSRMMLQLVHPSTTHWWIWVSWKMQRKNCPKIKLNFPFIHCRAIHRISNYCDCIHAEVWWRALRTNHSKNRYSRTKCAINNKFNVSLARRTLSAMETSVKLLQHYRLLYDQLQGSIVQQLSANPTEYISIISWNSCNFSFPLIFAFAFTFFSYIIIADFFLFLACWKLP